MYDQECRKQCSGQRLHSAHISINRCSGKNSRTLRGTTDWFKLEKGVRQGCLLSPCLFKLCTEHIMRNAGLDELQARIKTGGRNINNLRYVDMWTLMAECKEELKSLWMMVKEESERASLKLNIKNLRLWHPAPLLHGK